MFDMILSLFSDFLFFILHVNPFNSFPPALSKAEEERLLKLAESGDKVAKNKLVEHNLRLVAHVIKKYYSATTQQEDLISIGTIGLIKAIDSFKSDKGTRLATYAARCIENEILMYFRAQKKTSQDISVNEPIDIDSEGNPLTLIDIIATEDTILDDIYLSSMSKKMYKYISEINDKREKEIIILRYGLNNQKPLTQREVAQKLNISRSYVSRIEKKVLSKLKERFEETDL
ncbi:MAG: RNA polymerase sporulation sigma factor SigK [Clostridia bacterium]|nr:RNA polymerase sporulation sigma factor SigK [Clostridia bacterium]